MTISESVPKLKHLSFFTYRCDESKYQKISFEKTQYTYRLLIVAKGSLSVKLGDKTENVGVSDIIYLTPGAKYRLLPNGNDFSLYNIFFDFENDDETGNATYGCVFLSNYDERLCTKKIEFKDVPLLNESGVFRGVDAAVRIFERLLLADSRNPYYTFNASAQIISILGELLISDSQNNSKGARLADRIVSYVYSNYDKSITPGKIASAFSYHQNYLNKLIKERFGKSLCEFIRAVKIEHAVALISENNSIPADIFQTLGYYDYSHFYKAFQKEIGLSPSEYVREHQ